MIFAQTLKFVPVDAPPPGGGFVTTIGKFPAVTRSEGPSVIVNCPEVTKVALWDTPLNVTVEDDRKPLPVIVTVWELVPAVTKVGEID
jgi:hypothetical protein